MTSSAKGDWGIEEDGFVGVPSTPISCDMCTVVKHIAQRTALFGGNGGLITSTASQCGQSGGAQLEVGISEQSSGGGCGVMMTPNGIEK